MTLLAEVKDIGLIIVTILVVGYAIYKLWEDIRDKFFPPEPIDPIEPTNLCGNYSGSINTMNPLKVRELTDNYQSNSSACDTESVRFSLEELKKFIFHAEVNAIARGITLHNDTLGIRFYYAAYSADPAQISYDPDFAGRHTLVMVPTCKVAPGVHVDFDASNVNTALSSSYTPLSQTAGASNISALNHGSLFPPMI